MGIRSKIVVWYKTYYKEYKKLKIKSEQCKIIIKFFIKLK